MVNERLIFDCFYFVGYYVNNIITDRFLKEKSVSSKKIIIIISLVILSMNMTNH